MAEATAPQFTSRVTKQGASFDALAKEAYGDQNYVRDLINDNPHLAAEMQLPSGVTVFFRLLENPSTGELMPIWLSEDEETGTTDPNSPPPILVVDGPGAVLGFSEGYPKIVGNHLEVAINKNQTLPYYFKKADGTIIAQSVGYPFSAGFPISMPDVVDGGYYYVQVGTLTSGLLSLPGLGALAFSQMPTITKVGDSWQLKFSLNKTGAYPAVVERLNDGTEPVNQVTNFTKDFVVTFTLSSAGNYRMTIGEDLIFEFSLATSSESTTVPSSLLGLGYRYDANSHEITFLLDMTEPLEMNVKAPVGTSPSGKDQDGAAWNAGTYNKGRTDYVAAPWDRRYSNNPLVPATGGLLPNTQYELRIRRTSTPGDVFLFIFRTPSDSTGSTPTEVDLETQNTACTVRPTIISGSLVADTDSMTFVTGGAGFKTLKWRVKDSDGEVVRSATIVVFDESGNAKFSPANQITVNYSPLFNADYTTEIEGGNCTSTPHSTAFEVTNYAPGTGGGTADSGLEIALIYDDSGTSELKVRIATGTAPYTILCTDGTDTIHEDTTSTQFYEIPDAVMADLDTAQGLLHVTVVDADGKAGVRERYFADRIHMKGAISLITVANGNPSNHKGQIDNAIANGLKYVGVICNYPDTDAKLAILTGAVYNHLSTPGFPYEFDETVKYAEEHDIFLKVGLPFDRQNNTLNNGTTRTKFFGPSNLMMRPNGTTPICDFPEVGNPIPMRMAGSISDDVVLEYMAQFAMGFNKRYKAYITSGRIAFINFTYSDSAEGEYPTNMIAGNMSNTIEGPSAGDFNIAALSRFKTAYPIYESQTGPSIAAADGNGSALALAWDEFLASELGRAEQKTWNRVYAAIPDLNRAGLEAIDVGSRFDGQSRTRRTRNMAPRNSKKMGLFKVNDNPVQGATRINRVFQVVKGFAQRNSARTVWEFTPTGGDFEDSTNRGYIVAGVNILVAMGGDVAFINNEPDNIDWFLDNTDVDLTQLLPQHHNTFNTSGSNKLLRRLFRKASDIFKTGVEGGWEDAITAYLTANSVSLVDTTELDDLALASDDGGTGAPDPGEGEGPTPSPGTGIFQPVVMYQGFEAVLKVNITGVGGSHSEDWIINVETNQVPAPGYRYYWMVDDVPYIQTGLITNIPYQSNEPGSVELMIQKTSGGIWYKWANPGEGPYIEGFSDPQLGQNISYDGTSASGALVVFGFQEVSA